MVLRSKSKGTTTSPINASFNDVKRMPDTQHTSLATAIQSIRKKRVLQLYLALEGLVLKCIQIVESEDGNAPGMRSESFKLS